MHLETLKLLNFKNYQESLLDFSPGVNCFTGANGCGKTNLLDAIYYLCMTKSAFNTVEQYNIRHGEDFFALRGHFFKAGKKYLVTTGLKSGQKKTFALNKKEYDKNSLHIGLFPCVFMAPTDTDLIREGSETRRKFFDSIICQMDTPYLESLIRYNALLKQRNNLLKQFAERNYFDKVLLETYDNQMLALGKVIATTRQQLITVLLPPFLGYYQFLTQGKEEVALAYVSEVPNSAFEQQFRAASAKDRLLQRTTMGIHRDDYLFTIGDHPLKKFGSQGQQKSFSIALKLAQFEVLTKATRQKPLLLLDDIFDKLDDLRINRLLKMIGDNQFGQTFITDARPERTRKLMAGTYAPVRFFDIQTLKKNTFS